MGAVSVLLVEDDPTLVRTIARNLSVIGYEVRTATTVEEAVTALCQELPGLLLLDIGLPDRCGWDVLRELRSRQRVGVPVIVMSVLRLDPQISDDLGVATVLEKPFSIEALLGLVTRFVARPRCGGGRSEPIRLSIL